MKYISPACKVINFRSYQLLCSSDATQTKEIIRQPGCPIKSGCRCRRYDKNIAAQADIKNFLEINSKNQIFNMASDELHCPNKRCPIYIEWQKQQTR